MAVVRLLSNLLRDKTWVHGLVPIVADEASYVCMANLFRQIGSIHLKGSIYTGRQRFDARYREARDGNF